METKTQLAVNLFSNNYNCSQAVFAAFANELGIDQNHALKIASPFGAGIAQMQSTCGAVTGALMAIGLKYGKGINGSDTDKQKAYQISKLFIEKFREQHKSIMCIELLDGLKMHVADEMAKIREQNMFNTRCPNFVHDAVEIVEKIFASSLNQEII